MISNKTLKALEFDKIMAEVSSYAVLERTKELVISFLPLNDINAVRTLLSKTCEAFKLLFTYSTGNIVYFDDITDQINFANKGGTLSCADLLKVAQNLKSARIINKAIASVNDKDIVLLREISNRLFINQEFEDEIAFKIISEDKLSDNASDKLCQIRKRIREINANIRTQLNSYMRGGLSKYLQDAVITMRQDRYVVPVKSEYRSFVKGFIHDQSSSGATVFIEPEAVMELNNELKRALLDEQNEIIRILSELSSKVASMSGMLTYNFENLVELDEAFCRAQYSFANKCTYPILNDKGVVNVKRGRHPLIDKKKVVPVNVRLGKDFNILLISGPNTGGKTVTLKLVGLCSLMVMSGLYVPCDDESEICIFNNVYCDIGDEQSIEQDLSTFSSHIKNIISIINNVDEKSLILIDEIGAGTDPDEGSALALSIIKRLLQKNCFGIITTHYSSLKEFAMDEQNRISNASMEFDLSTLKPLYKLILGVPGSSNAINIAKTLGLDNDIILDALSNMSEDKIKFEKIIQSAEESRRENERLLKELELIKVEKEEELQKITQEKDKVIKEKEKIVFNAKQETKRIVADKLADAEEIILELKKILKEAELESKQVFKASELKNRLKNSVYLSTENVNAPVVLEKSTIEQLKIGNVVYVKSLDAYCKILSINNKKGEAEVSIGGIKSIVKIKDLYNSKPDEKSDSIKVNRKTSVIDTTNEINVIGKTSLEALSDVDYLIDRAVIANLEEIKIIHGVGEGILLKAIREHLKKDKRVAEFRRGKYGEGENGVTIVKLK